MTKFGVFANLAYLKVDSLFCIYHSCGVVLPCRGGCNYLKDVSYSNLQEEDLIRLGSFLIVAGSYFLAGGCNYAFDLEV